MRLRFCSSLALVFSVRLLAADSAEVTFQKAASALSSQNYPAAEQGFLAVLKLEPRNVGALGNLGVVYSQTNRPAAAIEMYKRALRIAPGDKGLNTNLGLAYVKQERYASALPVFEKLAADPANTQARQLLATCEISLGQYQPALALLLPLVAAQPEEPATLYMLGVVLTRLKRTEEAHAAFTKMMAAVSPAQANFLMGKASYETENFEQAADFFRKALAEDTNFEGAHRELGKTLLSLRDNENAEKELRQARPDDTEALYYLGVTLSQTRPTYAIPILSKARDQNPDLWGPLFYLGRIYLDQGSANEALPLLERAAKLNPEESAIQYQLGRAYQKAGKPAAAAAAFARVKELKSRSLAKEVNALSPPDRKP